MTDELNNPQTPTPETIETPEVLAFDYRYISLLGEGANGKTWKAKNRQTGQLVAIKALKLSQSENFKSFELFKREAEVLASVRIQGVPQFYQSVNTDEAGGECFIVQEYIDAPAIQTYLDNGRIFTESETLKLILHVAEILRSLHTVYTPPIIHRDIKPSNILCEMPEGGLDNVRLNPYLIDFGAVANPQNKSGSSTIAGTYGYMAPEENDRIPAARALAKELGLNPNTVAKAYGMLERDGIIYSVSGKGCFVAKHDGKADKRMTGDFEQKTRELLAAGITADALIEIVREAEKELKGGAS